MVHRINAAGDFVPDYSVIPYPAAVDNWQVLLIRALPVARSPAVQQYVRRGAYK